ncbi:MAG: hypothetical protein PHU61_00995 [Candidatus Absconditabacteria bacterium]|nr:hypothetical protein [Candidatus Absconditabacteria bacterium]MDD3868743.1 hypothetical protein [Candidatus Absconditabacteria bacterium]MDD4714372.1 hypothetical protein [Candidatus Absconditabacteria bacterium]
MNNISRALIFDSVFDPYKGVLAYVKVVEGSFKAGEVVHLIHSQNSFAPTEVGHFTPEYQADKTLSAGQIGYITTGQKSVREVKIGDTIISGFTPLRRGETRFSGSGGSETQKTNDLQQYLIPGFKKVTPFVYAGVYPIDSTEYDKLKDSLEKLSLNDSAVEYEMEESGALGLGFRCGFLGMLHMDIIKERLRREYGLDTIFTIPTVIYLVKSKNLSIQLIKSGNNLKNLIATSLYKAILKKENYQLSPAQEAHIEHSQGIFGNMLEDPEFKKIVEILRPRIVVKSGSEMIEQGMIEEIREPLSEVEIVGPKDFAGNIMALCQEYRGNLKSMEYLDESRVVWKYHLPMGEIIIDFYDRLKSATKGYATMNYEFKGYEPADLVKLDIFINNEKVEALTRVVHKDNAYYKGRDAVEKLKTLIPRQLFSIPIQAGLGSKVIARETISAMKKDVLAKCYGGDVSRKRKLLQKQKEGKKRMKAIGNVEVPSDIFVKMISRN